jgi:Flp pilus assembly protein TadG
MAALTRRRRRLGDDAGAELIELALVLPILLLAFAAIIDFGFLFQRFEVVTNAAREGARLASLNYSQADVEARVQSYLQASGLTGAPTPTVNATLTQTLPSGEVIPRVEVVVSYPAGLVYLGPIATLVGGSGHSSFMLRARSVMRREPGGG